MKVVGILAELLVIRSGKGERKGDKGKAIKKEQDLAYK